MGKLKAPARRSECLTIPPGPHPWGRTNADDSLAYQVASQPIDCPFDSGGAVARTRLQVPEFDQLCDDCQRRNTPLEADNNAAHATPPKCPRQRSFYGLSRKKLARSGPSSSGAFNGNRFPQQEVFQDELPFAGNERSAANTACDFESDGLRPRFGFDDLVKRVAAWAELSRRHLLECLRHRHPPRISRSLSTPIRDMAMANPEVCVVPIVEVRPRFSMTSSVVMLRVQTRLVSASDFRE